MKLLYLYFTYRSKFKRIFADDIEFNFDSEIRFKLNGGELKRINSVGELPKGFFSVLPQNRTSPAVDSVSVIAGGNGAGKTSLVEVLLDIKEALDPSQASSKFKAFIVVYCSGAGNECYYESNIPNLKTPDGLRRPAKAEANNDYLAIRRQDVPFLDVPLIYVTPHFTPYALTVVPDLPKAFSDLSTFGMMRKAEEKKFNEDGVAKDPIGAYKTEQTRWTLSFVRAEQELPAAKRLPPEERPHKKELPLDEDLQDEATGDQEPVFQPIGIRVSLSKVVVQKLRSKTTTERVKRILKNVEPGSNSSFFEKVFYAYAGLYVNDQNSAADAQLVDENDQGQCDAWERSFEYEKDLTDLFSGELRPNKENILHFLGNQKEYQQKNCVNAVRAFFKKLGEILDLIPQQELNNASHTGSIVLDMKSQESFERLLKLVDLHFRAKAIVPFLDFDTEPRMSAGERAFFDTWGRLYHHFLESIEVRTSTQEGTNLDLSAPRNWPERKDAIIFFDESETTMHPEWQRRIVRRMIWFFEAFASWVHPHLIFATHSPILLSDVPAGNVVLLERENNQSVVRPIDETKAFASNIFDLYRNSFFLKSGCTMGAFAASKVNPLLKKFDPGEPKINKQELNDVLSLAKMIGDPFISGWIWRRLDTLVDDDGDLRVD